MNYFYSHEPKRAYASRAFEYFTGSKEVLKGRTWSSERRSSRNNCNFRTKSKRYDKFNFLDEQGDLHAITDFNFSEPFEQFPGAVVLDNNLILQNPYGEIDCICFQELVQERSARFIIFMLCKKALAIYQYTYSII